MSVTQSLLYPSYMNAQTNTLLKGVKKKKKVQSLPDGAIGLSVTRGGGAFSFKIRTPWVSSGVRGRLKIQD